MFPPLWIYIKVKIHLVCSQYLFVGIWYIWLNSCLDVLKSCLIFHAAVFLAFS